MCSKRGRRLVRRLRPPRVDDAEDELRLSRGSSSGSATAGTVAPPLPAPLDEGVPASAGSPPPSVRPDECSPVPLPEPRLRDRRLRLRVLAVPLPDWACSPSAPSSEDSPSSPTGSVNASAAGATIASSSEGGEPSAAAESPPADRLLRRRGRPSRGAAEAESSFVASDEAAPRAGVSASADALVSMTAWPAAGATAAASASDAPAFRRGARERRSANGAVGAPSLGAVLSVGGASAGAGAGVAAFSAAAAASASMVALDLRVRVRATLLGFGSPASPPEAAGAAGASGGVASTLWAAPALGVTSDLGLGSVDVSAVAVSPDTAVEAAGARRLRGALAVGGLFSTAPAG